MRRSMKRPGVVTIMWAPLLVKSLISLAIDFTPPISTKCENWGKLLRNLVSTSSICDASSRVGEIIKAPISCLLRGVFRASKISNIGIRNARVFPEPVTASAHTSFFCNSNGIQAAYWNKQVTELWQCYVRPYCELSYLNGSSLFKFKFFKCRNNSWT